MLSMIFVISLIASPNMAKAGQIEDFFTAKGLSQEQTQGILAGIYSETGFRKDIVYGNQTTAHHHPFGIGQWLGYRKRRLFAIYGPHPTLNQQLWFLWEELNGDDPCNGGYYVLRASTRHETLRAYVTHFMRPGAQARAEIRRGTYYLAMNDTANAP